MPQLSSKPVRVLVVDDSAIVRKVLSSALDAAPGIEVVDTATDPLDAREKIKRLCPDVITLDVEMPKMDGITFLKNIMRLRPMPVVMISSLTESGASVTLDALEIGAVDFHAKPGSDTPGSFAEYVGEVAEKVRNAPMLFRRRARRVASAAPSQPASAAKTGGRRVGQVASRRFVALGASTGGTEAIREVVVGLPAEFPGIVVVQHIPAAFAQPFANRVDASAHMVVKVAEDGEPVLNGHVYIAPGDRHLRVVRDAGRYLCVVFDAEPVNRHKPSVDVLFESVAESAKADATGVLLTGMGRDGAEGLLEMRRNGSATIVQDEQTSVVWGMPGSAFEIGAAQEVLPIEDIAPRLRSLFSDQSEARARSTAGGSN